MKYKDSLEKTAPPINFPIGGATTASGSFELNGIN